MLEPDGRDPQAAAGRGARARGAQTHFREDRPQRHPGAGSGTSRTQEINRLLAEVLGEGWRAEDLLAKTD
ncbi:MAG: hypothetical protein MZV70_18155 [Desulfobacterales bacterium]|nr:hypothetical protein [Desulfobacterales bacterium]